MDEPTIDRICQAFEDATAETGITGIAYRAWCEDNVNVICLHEALGEWFGGKHDGEQIIQGFSADLGVLTELFDEPPEIHLDATVGVSGDGPAVSMEGEIDGESWDVRLFTEPPVDAEAGIVTDGMQYWVKD